MLGSGLLSIDAQLPASIGRGSVRELTQGVVVLLLLLRGGLLLEGSASCGGTQSIPQGQSWWHRWRRGRLAATQLLQRHRVVGIAVDVVVVQDLAAHLLIV